MKTFIPLVVFVLIFVVSCSNAENTNNDNTTIDTISPTGTTEPTDTNALELDKISYRTTDSLFICSFLKKYADSLYNEPISKLIIDISEQLKGSPYSSGTLDGNVAEKLKIRTDGYDCVTFVENTIVYTRLIKQGKTGFLDFCNEMQKIRYRNGIMGKYPSRLHYFTDWIYDNAQRNILQLLADSIGEPYSKKINFMTINKDKYGFLANDTFYNEMKSVEEQMNKRSSIRYFPKDSLNKYTSYIKNGDIVAITTKCKGLDVSHVGFAVFVANKLHLLHASSKSKKIVVSNRTLFGYLQHYKNNTGIIVCRLVSD